MGGGQGNGEENLSKRNVPVYLDHLGSSDIILLDCSDGTYYYTLVVENGTR